MKNDLRSAYSGNADTATAKPSKDEEISQVRRSAAELMDAAQPSKNVNDIIELNVQIVDWFSKLTNAEGNPILDGEGRASSVKRNDLVGVKMVRNGKPYTRTINSQRINPNLMNIGIFAANVEMYEQDNDFMFGVSSVTPVISKLTTNQILLMGGNIIKV